jgi:hypothetical protein
MAKCENCGTTYRGGAAVHGKLKFCTHACRDQGKKLELLDNFPPLVIEAEIKKMQVASCGECLATGNIDVHKSHRVHSVILWTSWHTRQNICCSSCGRKHRWKAIGYSAALGWWGIPFGLIVTPIQIIRNIAGMMRSETRPSSDFIRICRLHLAERVAAAERNSRSR